MDEASHPILSEMRAPLSESILYYHIKKEWILLAIDWYNKYFHLLVANEFLVLLLHSDERYLEVTEIDLGEGRVYGLSLKKKAE